MLSISQFARYVGVSVRMLRHYDALGLLVPERVDPATGYRWYAAGQINRANRLIALKELGFGLDRLGPILDAEVGADELRGMLLLRREELAERIAGDVDRLAEVERRLRSIEGGTMSELEFTEKALPAVRLAQLTDRVAEPAQIGTRIGPMFGRLSAALAQQGLDPSRTAIAWYVPDDAEPDQLRIGAGIETALEASGPALEAQGVEVADLAAVPRAVTVIHQGAMSGIGRSWEALQQYVDSRGLTSVGVCRELYLNTPDGDQSDWVTELQQPVG